VGDRRGASGLPEPASPAVGRSRLRWLHEGVDRLFVAAMHPVVPPLFRHGSTSPSLREHLATVELQVPPLLADGRHKVTARTIVGEVQAGFRIRHGSNPAYPVLICHHGLAEIPCDRTFRFIFPRRMPLQAHLVVVRAPFHRHHIDALRGMASLSRFLAMCAVSVTLIEALRRAFLARGAQGCVVAGISLGGFVSLLHHLNYGTANCYVPLLAGPDLAYSLLSSPFHRFLAPQARAQPAHVLAGLDYREAFRASDTARIFPLLARHDLCMPYAHYQAAYAASGVEVATIQRGHMTSAVAFAALRAHLLGRVRALAVDTSADSVG
jgi:hypothetical protein